MTASRDPDRMIDAFLQEGAEQLGDQVYNVVRAEIERKRQRVVIGLWRTPTMNRFVTYGLAAAAVVAIVVIGSQLLRSPNGGLGSQPTPSPTATAQPTSTPEAFVPEPFEFAWDGMSDRAPRITVTIPAAGWNEGGEGTLGKGNEADNVPEAAFIVYSEAPGTAFYVWGDPCNSSSTRPERPATTVDEIVAALAAQASRDASEPVDVTVGGYAGKAITLHVPDDANFDACDGQTFATFGTDHDEGARTQQGPGQIDDVWVIDVDGAVVIIDAMYRPDSQADILEEMRSIAESATFELP